MKSDGTIEWLLEDNQPAIRYLTLTELVEKTDKDPEAVSARELLTTLGYPAFIMSYRERSQF